MVQETPPPETSRSAIADWVLDHLCTSLIFQQDSGRHVLYASLVKRILPFTSFQQQQNAPVDNNNSRDDDKFPINLLLAQIKQGVGPTFQYDVELYLAVVETLEAVEKIRRDRVALAVASRSDSGTDELKQASEALEKLFEAAILGLKRQLIVQFLYQTPFAATFCTALLHRLLPNTLFGAAGGENSPIPIVRLGVDKLRARLSGLIHDVEIHMLNRRLEEEPSANIPQNRRRSVSLLAELPSVPAEKEREWLDACAGLSEFDSEFSWEQARAVVDDYCRRTGKFLASPDFPCLSCGKEQCEGIIDEKTILSKILQMEENEGEGG
ncbi:hypothetical protein HK104_007050, partial [Borealophlyctis nickersoniae]